MTNYMQRIFLFVMNITLVIISLTACGGTTPPTTPVNQPTSFHPTIYLAEAEHGQAIEVRVDDVSNFFALDLRLAFAPNSLQIIDADPQTEGIQLQTGSAPVADFVVSNKVDPTIGTVEYLVTQLGPRDGFQGDGLVATILVEDNINLNTLSIKSALLADEEGHPIQVDILNTNPELASIAK